MMIGRVVQQDDLAVQKLLQRIEQLVSIGDGVLDISTKDGGGDEDGLIVGEKIAAIEEEIASGRDDIGRECCGEIVGN